MTPQTSNGINKLRQEKEIAQQILENFIDNLSEIEIKHVKSLLYA